MDIKIPANGPVADPTSQVDSTTEPAEAVGAGAEVDPTVGIAQDLAAGKIDKDQAIDRIISQTLDAELVASAPAELRQEIAEVLENLIQTDPGLKQLARAVGITKE